MICTGEIYGEEKLSLLDVRKKVRESAFSRLREVIDFASSFSCPVNIGRIRGNFNNSVPEETSWEWIIDYFTRLASYSHERKVVLALEPLNRFQGNFINTTIEGLEMVKKVGNPSFRLMLDLFHMNIEDRSFEENIKNAARYIVHVHICDSNRQAPGRGHLNFLKIIKALREINYSGYLSGEVLPIPDSQTAAWLTARYMKHIFQKINKCGKKN